MSPDRISTSNTLAKKFILLASLLAVMVGGMVLIGWTFDIAVLKSILPIWVSMKANTAICFILLGVALWLLTPPPPLSSPNISIIVGRLIILLVGMIGLLTLSEYIFGWNLGIDQWLFVEPTGAVGTSYPGRMAPDTALDFVMLSVALWLLGISHKTSWMIVVSMSIGLLLVASALAAMLTYFTPSLGSYGWFGLTIMAMNTALLFTLLGMAIIAANWNSKFVSWSLSRNITVVFACGILVLVLVGLNTNRSQYWMGETNRQISFSETVLRDIETLLINVLSAQSSTRGYIITGDEVFKAGYLQAKANSLDKLNTLHKVVVGHLHQEQQFAQIETHVNASLQWFQQVVDARTASISDAERNKKVHHGQILLDNLQNTFHQIKKEHQQRIQQMKQEAEAVSSLSYLALFGGTVTSLLIFLAVIFRLNFAVRAQKLAEKKNYRMTQLYNALSHCNHAIVHSSDEQELFSQLCSDAVQFGGMKMAWIGLLDDTSQRVLPVASFGAGIGYLDGIEISVDPNDPKGRGPTGTCIRESKPFWCQDYQHDPATAAWHEWGARFDWGASASLPLLRNGVVVGAFTVYEGEANTFDAATQDLLVEMAMDISFALDIFSREAKRKLTEIKLAEIAFKTRFLSDALDNLSSSFVYIKDLNGRYLYANQATLNLFKCSAEQLVGQDDAKFFLPETVARIKIIDKHVLENDEPTMEELEVSPNSPERRVYWEVKTPLYDSTRKIIGLCGISTDITSRKRGEELLRESEEQFRIMFSEAPLGIALIDSQTGHIHEVNPMFAKIAGRTLEQMANLDWMSITHPDDVQTDMDNMALMNAGKIPGFAMEKRYLHPEGAVVWINMTIAPLKIKDKVHSIHLCMIEDITERKRDELNLKDTEAKFQALVEQSIAGTYIIQEGKFSYVNPRFKEILGYGDDDSLLGKDVLQIVEINDREEFGKHLKILESVSGNSQSFLFSALRKDGLKVEVGITGTLATYQNCPATIGMMQDISDRKVAEQQIERYTEQLQRTFMQTVSLVTTLSEMRDPYTVGHERRVADIAVAIGGEMGLNDLQLTGLKVGGYLHDVGKTSIPLEILSKPGKISPLEYEMIKSHPQAGYDVMKDVDFPWPVAQIALQHHERMDGSGYPNELKGEEILLEARIIAVADVVEAMATHRPYRPGLGIDLALAEIERGRGTAYDPVAVDICLDLFRNKGYTLPP